MSKKLRYKNLFKKSKELFSSSGNKEAAYLFQEGLSFTTDYEAEQEYPSPQKVKRTPYQENLRASSPSDNLESSSLSANQQHNFAQRREQTSQQALHSQEDRAQTAKSYFTLAKEEGKDIKTWLEIPPSRYYHLKRLQKLKSLANYSLLYQGQVLAFQEQALWLLPPQSNLWLLNNPEAKFYYLLTLNQSYSRRLPLLSIERNKGTSLLIPNVIDIILKQWPLEIPLRPLLSNPFFSDPRLFISTRANRYYLEEHNQEFLQTLALSSLDHSAKDFSAISPCSSQVLHYYLHSPSQLRMSGFSLFRFWDESFLPLVNEKLGLSNILGFSCRYGLYDERGVSYPLASGLGSGSYYGLALPNFIALPFILPTSPRLTPYLLVEESVLYSYFNLESYLKAIRPANYHYYRYNLYNSTLSHFPQKSRDLLSDLNSYQQRIQEQEEYQLRKEEFMLANSRSSTPCTTYELVETSHQEENSLYSTSSSSYNDQDREDSEAKAELPYSSSTPQEQSFFHEETLFINAPLAGEEIIDLSDEDDFYYPQINEEGKTILPQALPRTQPQQLQSSPYEGHYSGAARTIDKIAESILSSKNKQAQPPKVQREAELLDYLVGREEKVVKQEANSSYQGHQQQNHYNQESKDISPLTKASAHNAYLDLTEEEDYYTSTSSSSTNTSSTTSNSHQRTTKRSSENRNSFYSSQSSLKDTEIPDPSLPSYLRETLVVKKHAPEISAAHGSQGIALNPSKENLQKEIDEELYQEHRERGYDDFPDDNNNFNPYARTPQAKPSFLPQSSLYGGYEGVRLGSLVSDQEWEEEEADYSYLDEVDQQTLDKLNYQQPYSAQELSREAQELFSEQAYPQSSLESKSNLPTTKGEEERYLQEEEIAQLLASGQISPQQAYHLQQERAEYYSNLYQPSYHDAEDLEDDFTEFEDPQDYNYGEDFYDDDEDLEELDEPLSDDLEEAHNLDLYLEDILLEGHYDHDGDFETEDQIMRARMAQAPLSSRRTAPEDVIDLCDENEDYNKEDKNADSYDQAYQVEKAASQEVDYSSALQESLTNFSEESLLPPLEEGFVLGGKAEQIEPENLFAHSDPGAFSLNKLIAKTKAKKEVKTSKELLDASQIFSSNLSQLNNYIPHLQKILEKLAPKTQILERALVAGGHRYELKLHPRIKVNDFIERFNQQVNSSRKLHAYQEEGRLFIKRSLPLEVKALDLLAKKDSLPPYHYPLALNQNNQVFTLELKNLVLNGGSEQEKSNLITTLLFTLFYSNSPEQIEVLAYLEDSNHLVHQLENLPHLINPLYYGNQSQEFIAFLYAELLRRRHLCATLNSRDYLTYNHFLQLHHQENKVVIKPLYVVIDSLGSWFNASLDPNSKTLGLSSLHYLFQVGKDLGIFFIIVNSNAPLDKVFTKGDFADLLSFGAKNELEINLQEKQFLHSEIQTLPSSGRKKTNVEILTSSQVYSSATISNKELTRLRDFWFKALEQGEVGDNYRSYNLEYLLSEDFYRYCIIDELIFNTGVKNKRLAQAFTYEVEGEFFSNLVAQLEKQNFITRRQEQLYVSISYPNFLTSPLAQNAEELLLAEDFD